MEIPLEMSPDQDTLRFRRTLQIMGTQVDGEGVEVVGSKTGVAMRSLVRGVVRRPAGDSALPHRPPECPVGGGRLDREHACAQPLKVSHIRVVFSPKAYRPTVLYTLVGAS